MVSDGVFGSSDGTKELSEQSQSDSTYYVLLARILKVSVRTIHGWVMTGRILQPTYFGNRAVWTEKQLDQILAEGTQPPGTYPPKFQSRAERMRAGSTPTRTDGGAKPAKPHRNAPTAKPKTKTRPPVRVYRTGRGRKGGRS